jgi:release factor glutamine methyltransferase
MTSDVIARLRAAGCVFAEDEAALLRQAASSAVELESLVAQRVSGVPLEHLLGWVEFHGLRVSVAPGVFVPRRRTEFLVEKALSFVRPDSVVVDLCCGCGALGAAVLAAVPSVSLYAADIDPVAVECARRNVPRAYAGDLFDALPSSVRGTVSVVLANVPYVPTEAISMMPPEARDHEPRVALDGGPDGLAVARRVLASAPAWLAPGGVVLFEASPAQAALLSDVQVVHSDEWDSTVVIRSHG